MSRLGQAKSTSISLVSPSISEKLLGRSQSPPDRDRPSTPVATRI
ncbi:MAG: hypothetical protein ACLFT0_12080 [Spirulinaceae cyanobacterium]